MRFTLMRILSYFLFVAGVLLCSTPISAQEKSSGAKGPQMTFIDETSYDFGEVERRGGDLIKVFRFRNDGDAPLVIKKVAKSCSCMTVDYSRKPIRPNEVGEIRLKYEPHKAEAGTFNKVVQIYTNTKKGVHLLTIQGKSLPKKRDKR